MRNHYQCNVEWKAIGYVLVEAESLEEAKILFSKGQYDGDLEETDYRNAIFDINTIKEI